MILLTILFMQLLTVQPIVQKTIYDVTKYGANPEGKTRIDAAVKKAIDAAASKGGGSVYFPQGKYLSGPIRLESNIDMHFADNVTITFTYDKKAGKLDQTSLIYSFSKKNISIRGRAILDGQGSQWWSDVSQNKPHFMYFHNTKNILLEDFTIINSPFMNVRPVECEDITIKGITINNPYKSRNTDGINCYSCKNLHISGVSIGTGDDCVALAAGKKQQSQNIVIADSHMRWGHSGVGIGSAIRGGLHNITVSNCTFDGTDRGLYIKSMRGRGGIVGNIHYKNITMHNIKKEGIVLNMLYDPDNQDAALHNRDIHNEVFREDTPVFRHIRYNEVRGDSVKNPIFFVGLPESLITDVHMENIDIKSNQQIFLNNTRDVVINGQRKAELHDF